jgi:hypothetical protein
MRFLVAVIALTAYGLSAPGMAFACPFMATAATHEEPYSDCPKEDRYPPEACILICPYTAEMTAVITADEHQLPLVLAMTSPLHIPFLSRVDVVSRAQTRELDSGGIYLKNRVLLI